MCEKVCNRMNQYRITANRTDVPVAAKVLAMVPLALPMLAKNSSSNSFPTGMGDDTRGCLQDVLVKGILQGVCYNGVLVRICQEGVSEGSVRRESQTCVITIMDCCYQVIRPDPSTGSIVEGTT